MSWVAPGSLEQQVAAVRDAHVAEPLWDGACWDMRTQHAGGASLCRWLQKDPFSGRRTEVIVERILCDNLDSDKPCWVLLEKSPDVLDWEKFSGQWDSFDIEACPKGHMRAVMEEGGRVIEPLTSQQCRVSMAIKLQLPAVIRWIITDSLLCFAVNMGAKSTMKSWDNIVDNWDSSEYPNVFQEQAHFYGALKERVEAFFRQSSKNGTVAD